MSLRSSSTLSRSSSALSRSSSDGQMTIEMMLVIIGLLSVGLVISKTARSQGWMNSLVSGPWKPMKAMIEDGVWQPANSKSLHPHHRDRHGSYEADPVNGDGGDGGDFG